jgi:hypothetical protein
MPAFLAAAALLAAVAMSQVHECLLPVPFTADGASGVLVCEQEPNCVTVTVQLAHATVACQRAPCHSSAECRPLVSTMVGPGDS